ncbi:triose-phosphate isomerase [Streptococcus porcinus]|uniref:Triosephosphate isomerase n=2 Tax=Streptococcus porcinus TaxID=1340 RepID=A0A4V0H256_STRPO|nr:triose-phosphate isomerase [Streptococcus porcinus]EGJ26976.1 triose-phosphate isomerase [Streptococcus porcinus str. Jelinkova 176]SQG42531.1 triosephosphate isomerase [Streptococcus porcinus]VTT41577.1 triosephosphate isomerase [Streptococcus porcinus]VTT42563.1 triosephosphate isomerase [Streptococcus porcinus]
MKASVNPNFFVFNPKSYLYGQELLELALIADQLADKDVSIFVTAPYTDLGQLVEHTENIIVTAQHLDGISPGRGMGAVLPDALVQVGVKAVFLNHAEHPMTLSQLSRALTICQKKEIVSIVCADSVEEARAIAVLKPDIILCEPTELIGTGKTSGNDYIEETNKAIKELHPECLVMQAAGISSAGDVYQTILAGADGTGCTSGIVKADNPKQMLIDMVKAVKTAIQER